jgi:hypothetical protein
VLEGLDQAADRSARIPIAWAVVSPLSCLQNTAQRKTASATIKRATNCELTPTARPPTQLTCIDRQFRSEVDHNELCFNVPEAKLDTRVNCTHLYSNQPVVALEGDKTGWLERTMESAFRQAVPGLVSLSAGSK